jgi:hypothetical protein
MAAAGDARSNAAQGCSLTARSQGQELNMLKVFLRSTAWVLVASMLAGCITV